MQIPLKHTIDTVLVLGLVAGLTAHAAGHDPEAVRLNNNGVAWMNQQQTEKAEASFAAAAQKDKTLPEALLNDGIALLYMQKLDEPRSPYPIQA